MAGTLEFNTNIDILGSVSLNTPSNSTGSILLRNTSTRQITTRTNAQFVSDLNLALKSELPVYTSSLGITKVGNDFRPNYGTTANTIAQGNDSRINNGQTAFGWGDFRDYGLGRTSVNITNTSNISLNARFYRMLSTATGNTLGSGAFLNMPFQGGQTFIFKVVSNSASVGSINSSGTVVKHFDFWTSLDFNQTNVNNWNTAFDWGNHASMNYWRNNYIRANNTGAVTDLDSTLPQGGFIASYSTGVWGGADRPNGASFGGYIKFSGNTADANDLDLYYNNGHGGTTSRLWYRTKHNSGITNWLEFIHTDNLDSQATSLGFIKSSALPTVNDGALTLSTGTGLSGSASFTANQSGNSSFSVGIASTHKLPTVAEWNALPTTNTITRLRGTASGTYTSGDLTLLAGANTTITQSGANITIASTNTNTTYTAGTNITITNGTISAVNTTYSLATDAELASTTSATARLISGQRLNTWATTKGFLTSVPTMTATVDGTAKLFSATVQSVASTAVSTTASRTYGIQKNSSGQLVVNVPWTNTTYSNMSIAEATAGTVATARLISAKTLADLAQAKGWNSGILMYSTQGGIQTKDWSSFANGDKSIALGSVTSTSGFGEIAIGTQIVTKGVANYNSGFTISNDSVYSNLVGSYLQNKGDRANLLGTGLVNYQQGNTVVGQYNKYEKINNSIDGSVPLDTVRLFTIGNGQSDILTSNAFEMYRDGSAYLSGLFKYKNTVPNNAPNDVIPNIGWIKANAGGGGDGGLSIEGGLHSVIDTSQDNLQHIVDRLQTAQYGAIGEIWANQTFNQAELFYSVWGYVAGYVINNFTGELEWDITKVANNLTGMLIGEISQEHRHFLLKGWLYVNPDTSIGQNCINEYQQGRKYLVVNVSAGYTEMVADITTNHKFLGVMLSTEVMYFNPLVDKYK